MCPRSTHPMRPYAAPYGPIIPRYTPHAAPCGPMCGPMRPHAHAPGVSARTPGARSNSENGALRHGHHGLSPNHRSIRSQGVKAPAAARCTGCTRLAARCTSSRRQAPGAPEPEPRGRRDSGRRSRGEGWEAGSALFLARCCAASMAGIPARLVVARVVACWNLGSGASLVIWFWVSIALLAASAQGTTCPLTQPR